MYIIRQWPVTHSRKLESLYRHFERALIKLHPLFKTLGYKRFEKPLGIFEKAVKGLMFDCQMSSVEMCALLTEVGYSPVLQISCRDKNRIAIQGDVLGAAAMGVSNVLCLSGDGVQAGDHPEARPVFIFRMRLSNVSKEHRSPSWKVVKSVSN